MSDSTRWTLPGAFDRAAPTYDAMVGLSPGYHAQLRRSADALVARLAANERSDRSPLRLLDLGAGSGASTAALVQAWRSGARTGSAIPEVTAIDSSAGMLAQAGAKPELAGVELVCADAASGLADLDTDSVDGILACYLVRNVPDADALLAQAARVLRPGAPIVVLDYSVADSRVARVAWAGLCHAVIIPLAAVRRSDVPLHRYLYRSVRDFDSIPVLTARLERAGFGEVTRLRHPGWQRGMVHTLIARLPA